MAQYFNQHSFSIFAIATWSIVSFVLLRKGVTIGRIIVALAIGGLFIVSWFLAKPNASDLDQIGSPSDQIGAGQPVLLELQSPY
jgi:hypothetical protein